MAEKRPVYSVQLYPIKMGNPTVGKTPALPSRIFLDRQLRPAAIRVFGLLASVAERNGHRYVRVGWLPNHLGTTERSVCRHLSNLKEAGYIFSEPLHNDTGRQGLNRYCILLDYRAWGDACYV